MGYDESPFERKQRAEREFGEAMNSSWGPDSKEFEQASKNLDNAKQESGYCSCGRRMKSRGLFGRKYCPVCD